MQWELGIDLGSYGVRMAQRENGVLFSDHSETAWYESEDHPFSYGEDARALTGRCPSYIKVRRPMRNGVIEDADTSRFWMQLMHRKAESVHKNRRGTLLLSCTPGSRLAHDEALMREALGTGVQEVGLVRSDAAAALGVGMDIMEPEASFIMEIGAGHVAASVWTMGRMAASGELSYGMQRVDEMLRRHLRTEKAFAIGESTSEAVRMHIGAIGAQKPGENVKYAVCGVDLKDRISAVKDLTSADVSPVMEGFVNDICYMLRGVLAQLPEELSADVLDKGLVIAGGGAHIQGLEKAVADEIGIPCTVAEEPEEAVVRGLYEILRRSLHYEDIVTDRMVHSGKSA